MVACKDLNSFLRKGVSIVPDTKTTPQLFRCGLIPSISKLPNGLAKEKHKIEEGGRISNLPDIMIKTVEHLMKLW